MVFFELLSKQSILTLNSCVWWNFRNVSLAYFHAPYNLSQSTQNSWNYLFYLIKEILTLMLLFVTAVNINKFNKIFLYICKFTFTNKSNKVFAYKPSFLDFGEIFILSLRHLLENFLHEWRSFSYLAEDTSSVIKGIIMSRQISFQIF